MQQHKQIFPLFFLFLLLSVLAISLFPQVNAITTYEWIQNGGFEDARKGIYFNECENLWYFTNGNELVLNTTVKVEGSSSINVVNHYVPNHQYNITNMDGIPYNSSTVLGAWFYMPVGTPDDYQGGYIQLQCENGLGAIRIGLSYDAGVWKYFFGGYDGDTTPFNYKLGTYTLGTWAWLEMAFYDNSNVTYYANGTPMGTYADATYYLFGQYDNLTCYTYLQAYNLFNVDYVRVSNSKEYPPNYVSVGQTTIMPNTLPWYGSSGIYKGITITDAHNGICSAYLGYDQSQEVIAQDINYLDSNKVSSISLYAKTMSDSNTSVQVLIVYSDRSTSYKNSVSFNSASGWIFLNYTNFILPNKIIIQFQFRLTNYCAFYVTIDDVSLLATIPSSQKAFSWDLSPPPINRTNIMFTAYQRTGYVFTGYVYDENGTLTENGVFTVTSTMSPISGNIINGTFIFNLVERNTVSDFDENIVIAIATSKVFVVQIVAHWVFVAGGDGDGGVGTYDTWYSNMVVTYMVLFIFIIVPPLIIAFEFAKHDVDPFMGFIGGLCLTVPIAYIVDIIDLWVLFVFVLGLILMILAKLGAFNRF